MIIGIGTDIVEVARIEELLARNGQRFARKILSDQELEQYSTHHNQAGFLAKRFAAKEAATKALGTGIGKVALHDIVVSNNGLGAPFIIAGETVQQRMQHLGATAIHLSLADERSHAIAFVIVESQ